MDIVISEFKNCDSIFISTSVCYKGRLDEMHSIESADSIKKILSLKLSPTKVVFLNTFNSGYEGVYHDKEKVPSWKHYILISKKQLYEPYEIPRHKKKWWKWR